MIYLLLANKTAINILTNLTMKEELTPKELTNLSHAHYRTILQYLEIMEELGLIKIRNDRGDPKQKIIKLTSEGEELSIMLQKTISEYLRIIKNHQEDLKL